MPDRDREPDISENQEDIPRDRGTSRSFPLIPSHLPKNRDRAFIQAVE